MTFPDTPLPTFAELYLGDEWVDITSDIRSTDGTSAIDVQRGITSSGGSVADRGTCTLTLSNQDGRYSARNPRSPYFGQLNRNTQLRTGILVDWSWLSQPYGETVTASTPDATALHITGDLDIRADLELASWQDQLAVSVAGRWDNATNCSWALTIQEGFAVLWWSPDGTEASEHIAFSTTIPAMPAWGRLTIRASLDVDNGAGGHTVTFYTAPTLAGPWTQLGDPTSDTDNPGTTSVFAGTRPLEVGHVFGDWTPDTPPSIARIYGVQVRNSAGTVVAAPDFADLTPGTTTWTDSTGRTWTAPAGAVTNRLERFTGEVSSWPPTWDTGGFDVTVPITASGILQRIQQGQPTLASPMRRSTLAYTSLRAYWPMEDAAGATQGASALPGGAPLRLSGVTWASDTALPGSGPLPVLAGAAQMTASVPSGAAGDWAVGMLINIPTLPATFDQLLVVNCTGGAAAQVQIYVDVTQVRIQPVTSDGTVLGTATITNADITSGWSALKVYTATAGGFVGYYVSTVDGTIFINTSGSPGAVASVTAAWSADLTGMGIGHLMVGGPTALPDMVAAQGTPGIDAPDRVYRTASDAGIQVSVIGIEAESQTLGPEPMDTALGVIQDAVLADEGLLYEAREFVGLRYRALRTLYNQPSALDLPYYQDPQPLLTPLTPVDDDQQLRNTSTVTRSGGSSATYTATDGMLTPALVGTYQDTATLNVQVDDDAIQHAAWRVHLGTWDEARFPSVTIEVAKDPSLIEAVSRIDTGSRIRITPPLPTWLPPEPIDLLVLGYEETIAQYTWRITFACLPYGPYKVGVWEDEVYCRADTAGSQLAAAATSTATQLSVATTAGAIWTSNPADLPVDLNVGGERVTLVQTGQVLNANSEFTAGTAGWTAGGGATLSWTASGGREGDGAALLTTTGAALPRMETTAMVPVTAGQQYRAVAWVRPTSAMASGISASVNWYDSSGTYLDTSGVNQTVATGAWTVLDQTYTAPAGAAKAGPVPTCAGTPTSGLLVYVDAARLIPVASYTSSPQLMTVVRSVNGITKDQAAGADVRLADPTYVAL